MSRTPTSDWIPYGYVARAHGVRGEVRVVPHHPGDELPAGTSRVQLRGPDGVTRVVGVQSLRAVSGGLLMRLEGVDGRDGADALRRSEVAVAREDLPALEPGEFYLHELIGAELRDEGGERLGVVEGFTDNRGQDLATVRTAGGTRLVPLVDGTIVRFDREAHAVTVRRERVEGLL